MRTRLTMTGLFLAMTAGCGQHAENGPQATTPPPPSAIKPAEPDPIERMKSLVEEGKRKVAENQRYQLVDANYDVRKSDSLVSPYEGVVKLQVGRAAAENSQAADYTVTINYVFRDGEWVFTSGSFSKRLASGKGYDNSQLRGEGFKELRGAVEPFGAKFMPY